MRKIRVAETIAVITMSTALTCGALVIPQPPLAPEEIVEIDETGGTDLLFGCGRNGELPFGAPSSWDSGDATLKKPVIYLYGYENTEATVDLNITGELTMTYPMTDTESRSSASWSVEGLDDGIILVNNKDYRYLFWEGNVNSQWTFNKGFCIEGSKTAGFLEDELSRLGLKSTEIADFITYWVPKMQNNPYNVISFQTKTYTENAKLTVTPSPNTILRIFMAWYPSTTMVNMTPQRFNVPARKGKTVVEWGGVQANAAGMTATTPDTTTNQLTDSVNTGTTPAMNTPTAPAAPSDPYAQYGTYAACARDWDSTAAPKCGQTWAQLDAGTKSAAYNHWVGHGTSGW